MTRRRHIVLVGLPGAGKSTVGRLVADALDAPYVDIDRVIEAKAGKSVERIFAEQGEPAFRALETEVGAAALLADPSVIAPGAGFFIDEGRRLRALSVGYVIYLETSPSVAARRLESHGDRPLLKGYDPTLRLAQLLEQREKAYLEAAVRVSTDGRTPDQVAEEVVKLARTRGGW